MKLLPLTTGSILATALAVASCTPSGSQANAGCNLDCANFPGVVTLHVNDSSGAPVASPSFSEQGIPLVPQCVGHLDWPSPASPQGLDAEAVEACPGWSFLNGEEGSLEYGPHTIAVAAAGYVSQTVTVVVPMGGSCTCGGPNVDQSVTLADAPIACGQNTCAVDQYCITPCCAAQCFSFPDASTCPAGYHYDVLCSGNSFGCRVDDCSPPPPFCSTDAGGCPDASAMALAGRLIQCTCQ